MIGFYVFGGGRGHLTRISRFIHQMRLDDFLIYTANPAASLYFPRSAVILFEAVDNVRETDLAQFLATEWNSYSFDDFYVDCFPFGILHEIPFESLSANRIHYLARRLKTSNYSLQELPIRFNSTFIFEPLEADHQLFVEQNSQQICRFDFVLRKEQRIGWPSCLSPLIPYWLVLHSSEVDEVGLLLMKALQLMERESRQIQLVLISDCCPPSYLSQVIWLKNEHNPTGYFENAEKIFSGAGFNTMQELRNHRNKHVCLPFERKFDDQKWRANNNETEEKNINSSRT